MGDPMFDDTLARLWAELAGRLHGPFAFRFLLQPLMAALYAARDGIVDAREGRPAYFWSILSRRNHRVDLLREGWKAVARVIGLGVAMDLIYQVMVFRTVHPFQLVVIVLALAFLPYLVLRGPINRIARYFVAGGVKTP